MCTSALSSCMCWMHGCCMGHDDDAGVRAWAASRDGMKERVEVLVPGPEGCPTVSSAVTPAGGVESGACDACMQQRPTRHATPPRSAQLPSHLPISPAVIGGAVGERLHAEQDRLLSRDGRRRRSFARHVNVTRLIRAKTSATASSVDHRLE